MSRFANQDTITDHNNIVGSTKDMAASANVLGKYVRANGQVLARSAFPELSEAFTPNSLPLVGIRTSDVVPMRNENTITECAYHNGRAYFPCAGPAAYGMLSTSNCQNLRMERYTGLNEAATRLTSFANTLVCIGERSRAFYRSNLAVTSWTRFTTNLFFDIAHMDAGTNFLYVVARSAATSVFRLWRTTDLITWTELALHPDTVSAFNNDPSNERFAVDGDTLVMPMLIGGSAFGLATSIDNGASWVVTSAGLIPAGVSAGSYTNSSIRRIMKVNGFVYIHMNNGSQARLSTRNSATWAQVKHSNALSAAGGGALYADATNIHRATWSGGTLTVEQIMHAFPDGQSPSVANRSFDTNLFPTAIHSHIAMIGSRMMGGGGLSSSTHSIHTGLAFAPGDWIDIPLFNTPGGHSQTGIQPMLDGRLVMITGASHSGQTFMRSLCADAAGNLTYSANAHTMNSWSSSQSAIVQIGNELHHYFAAGSALSGSFRSADNGATWTSFSPGALMQMNTTQIGDCAFYQLSLEAYVITRRGNGGQGYNDRLMVKRSAADIQLIHGNNGSSSGYSNPLITSDGGFYILTTSNFSTSGSSSLIWSTDGGGLFSVGNAFSFGPSFPGGTILVPFGEDILALPGVGVTPAFRLSRTGNVLTLPSNPSSWVSPINSVKALVRQVSGNVFVASEPQNACRILLSGFGLATLSSQSPQNSSGMAVIVQRANGSWIATMGHGGINEVTNAPPAVPDINTHFQVPNIVAANANLNTYIRAIS